MELSKAEIVQNLAHQANQILQHCLFFNIFICNFCISDADADFEADSMINEVQNNKCLGIDLQIVPLQQPFASARYLTRYIPAGEVGIFCGA